MSAADTPSKHHVTEDTIPENKEIETPVKNFIDHLNEHHLDLFPHKRTRTLSEYVFLFVFFSIYVIN